MTRKKYASKVIRSIKSQGIPHIMACKLSAHWMSRNPGRISNTSSLPSLKELLRCYIFFGNGGLSSLPGYDKSGVSVDMYWERDSRDYDFLIQGVLL